MPGLDGLRALSVLAVIAYHLKLSWAPGGLLGVGVFFTLSGYLITDQLMMEWQRTRRLDLKNFWIRRVRRLLPAVFFLLITVSLWLYYFDQPRLISLRGDFLSAIFYFNNWWLIFHKVSYFESFGPLSPIGHLWSLAIEEQFYILWPLLLVLILRLVPRRGSRTLIILIGAAASAVAMALIYQPGTDPSRVYYGTDTRAFALLIGAALALIWPSWDQPNKIPGKSPIMLDLLGGGSLLAIFLMIGYTNQYNPLLYQYGLAIFAILSAIVIVPLTHPTTMLSRILGCKPLRWLGVRSYGIYLWHYPIIILTNPTIETGALNIGRAVLQVALTVIMADISWKYIEEPIRRGGLRKLWKRPSAQTLKPRFALIMVIALLDLMILPGFVTPQGKSSASAQKTIIKAPSVMGSQASSPSSDAQQKTDNIPGLKPRLEIQSTEIPGQKPPLKTEPSEIRSGQGITAIGDSVMLGAAPYLEKVLPGIIVDGEVGRQIYQAQDVVNRLKQEGKLGDIVIIELGSNGPFSEKQMTSLLASLGNDKKIVLVNTRVPRAWESTVNSDLQKIAAEMPNTTLVDWFSASQGHDSYFYPDGVHLTPEGAGYYAAMLSQAICKDDK